MSRKNTFGKKRAAYLKQKAARFAGTEPPARIHQHFSRRTVPSERALTPAQLRAISAVTDNQI